MFLHFIGVKYTTMNIHLLQHLPECVKRWGPLWSYTCFHFETMNGYLKFLFHGTKDMSKQVHVYCLIYVIVSHICAFTLHSWRFRMSSCSASLQLSPSLNYHLVQCLLLQIYSMERKSKSCRIHDHGLTTFMSNLYRIHKQDVCTDVSVLGGVSLKAVMPEIVFVLGDFLQKNGHRLPLTPLTTVYRVNVRGTVYHCKQYKRVKKRNSYTVAYSDSDGTSNFGLIECFVVVDSKVIAVFHPLIPVTTSQQYFNCTNSVLDFILPVTTESSFKCCFVEDIVRKCIFIDFTNEQYVVQFPSSIMFD